MAQKENSKLKDLKKKLKITNLDELNSIFEIGSVKDDEFSSREVRRRVVSKFEFLMGILNNFLHPDSTILEMNDAGSLSDSDREDIMSILRQISFIIKKHQMLEIATDDKQDVLFINDAFILYKKINTKVMKLIEKTMKQMQSVESTKESINYLG